MVNKMQTLSDMFPVIDLSNLPLKVRFLEMIYAGDLPEGLTITEHSTPTAVYATLDQAYQSLESHLVKLVDHKEPHDFSHPVKLNMACFKIAENAHRGAGNTMYKNLLMYHSDALPMDRVAQVIYHGSKYHLFIHPNAVRYIEPGTVD